MMLELAQAVTVTWGQLGALAAVFLGIPAAFGAAVKFGDRLWGRKNGNGRMSMDARVAKLESHACHAGKELTSIKQELQTLNNHFIDFLKGRR